MLNTNTIDTNAIANDAEHVRYIISTEKNGDNLIKRANNIQRIARRTGNLVLADLGTEAHRRGRALNFDGVMPAVKNDSKIEKFARYAAVRACSMQDKMSPRANQMFARWGYAESAVRLVNKTRGNKMFHKMCELGLGEFTAEYIVYKYMLDLVSVEIGYELFAILVDAGVEMEG